MTDKEIWNLERLEGMLQDGGWSRPWPSLNPAMVPDALQPIIPYAQCWGFPEQGEQCAVADALPIEAIENLCAVAGRYEGELMAWLGGPLADLNEPSNEYVAFSVLHGRRLWPRAARAAPAPLTDAKRSDARDRYTYLMCARCARVFN